MNFSGLLKYNEYPILIDVQFPKDCFMTQPKSFKYIYVLFENERIFPYSKEHHSKRTGCIFQNQPQSRAFEPAN